MMGHLHFLECPRKVAAFLAMVLVAAVLLGGCAAQGPTPAGASNASGAASSAIGADFVWSVDSDCGACHVAEAASAGQEGNSMAQHETVACTTCHTDSDKLEAQHEGVSAQDKMPKRLKKTAVERDACLSCHDQGDLSARTQASDALTDEKGTAVNPHDLPEVDDHETIACADCHKMHGFQLPEESAPEVCTDCHHKNVYECGTCHEMR